jgi:predicted nucleic acid-binding protein
MNAARYVFDACALIAFLTGEDGADIVKSLLDKAVENEAEIHMHRINLLEVYYDAYKVGGVEQADKIYRQILNLPMILNDGLDDELFRTAGEFKATNRISLADAVAVSLAIKLNALLVTSDHHEFDVIEATGCASFAWIR